MRDSPAERVAVLLLHEDYPHELPVYHVSKTPSDAPDAFDRVICVLGAVRDATKEEEAAVVAAAKSLGVRVIGANLGRVAEFTSKIIGALSAHAVCRQLGPALSELLRLAGDAESSIAKLAPARAGGWTWDGKNNRSTVDESSIQPAASSHVGAKPLHLHFVTFLGFPASELTASPLNRESMHPAVAVVVNALWRSRLGSESSGDEAPGPVVPSLTLVFQDGVTLTVTQASLAVAMAAKHQAAPSEYQVLTTLVALLAKQGQWQAQGDLRAAVQHTVEAVAAEARNTGEAAVQVLQLRHASSDGSSDGEQGLSHWAYASDLVPQAEGPFARYVCLLDPPLSPVEVHKAVASVTTAVVTASVVGPCVACSPAVTLALLQHWAYNRRFVPVMEQLWLLAREPFTTTTTMAKKKKKKKKKRDFDDGDEGEASELIQGKKKKKKKEKEKEKERR